MSVEELIVWLIKRHKKSVERRAVRRPTIQEMLGEKVVSLPEGVNPELPKQKAREFFEALINKDFEKANAIKGYGYSRYGPVSPKLEESEIYSNVVRIISIGEPYQRENREGKRIYASGKGIFLPFEIELADGTVRKSFISMRCDNKEEEWQFDGGL